MELTVRINRCVRQVGGGERERISEVKKKLRDGGVNNTLTSHMEVKNGLHGE